MRELRPGWTWTTIGEIADVDGGLTKNDSKRARSTNIIPLVSVAAVHLRRVRKDEIGSIGLLPEDGDRGVLRRGDLLIVEGNGSLSHIGRVALWDLELPGARHQNHIIRVRARSSPQAYILEWLASPGGRDAILDAASSAAGLYTLSISKVQRLPVPLAPGREQHRIVAKLEQLFARSRKAREALDQIPRLLERLRQSILAAAFRGDLTAGWRARNPNVEPASELLKRIRGEHRARWEAAELAKMRAKGKLWKDDRWKERYVHPKEAASEVLPQLPAGWAWVSVDEVCPVDAPAVYGIILPGDDVPNGVPYIRPIDIRDDGTIDFSSIKRTSREIAIQYSRASLKEGDVVLSIVGTIGKVISVPAALDGGNITQSSVRIRPPHWLASEYLRLALLSPPLKRQYDSFRFGNAVQRLNVDHVRQLAIPLAPLDEARVILATVNEKLASLPCEIVAKARTHLDRVETSMLQKAFRGELVPQDPTDEPALVQLERVRALRQGDETTSGSVQTPRRRRG